MDSGSLSRRSSVIGFTLASVFGIVAALLVRQFVEGSVTAPQIMKEVQGTVSKVIDGDSLYLKGYDQQIRLWGVDAPERNELGFHAATMVLTGLVLKQPIRCNQVDVDRYGRTVARCFLNDGREINAEMIRSGSATDYLRFSNGFYTKQLKL